MYYIQLSGQDPKSSTLPTIYPRSQSYKQGVRILWDNYLYVIIITVYSKVTDGRYFIFEGQRPTSCWQSCEEPSH